MKTLLTAAVLTTALVSAACAATVSEVRLEIDRFLTLSDRIKTLVDRCTSPDAAMVQAAYDEKVAPVVEEFRGFAVMARQFEAEGMGRQEIPGGDDAIAAVKDANRTADMALQMARSVCG